MSVKNSIYPVYKPHVKFKVPLTGKVPYILILFDMSVKNSIYPVYKPHVKFKVKSNIE